MKKNASTLIDSKPNSIHACITNNTVKRKRRRNWKKKKFQIFLEFSRKRNTNLSVNIRGKRNENGLRSAIYRRIAAGIVETGHGALGCKEKEHKFFRKFRKRTASNLHGPSYPVTCKLELENERHHRIVQRFQEIVGKLIESIIYIKSTRSSENWYLLGIYWTRSNEEV